MLNIENIFSKCWFQQEKSPSLIIRFDSEVHPKARDVSLLGVPAISVSIKERYQLATGKLPIGARSILLDARTNTEAKDGSVEGRLLFRGLNKFADAMDLPNDMWNTLASSSGIPNLLNVVVQRKIGGFLVSIFSTDGTHLVVMAKHTLEGPHVQAGRRILQTSLDASSQAHLAHELFSRCLVVLCECVDTALDANHPVLEDAAHSDQLHAFAVQHMLCRKESALPASDAAALCRLWGIPFVEQRVLDSSNPRTGIEEAVRECQLWTTSKEGFVLVWEFSGAEKGFVFPLRLKLKTVQYKVLRLIRSFLGCELSPATHLSSQPDIFKSFVQWCRVNAEAVEQSTCWRSLFLQYQAALSPSAFNSLCSASARQLCVPSVAAEVLNVIIFCGLPGSGKTSICQDIVSVVPGAVHLQRDLLVAEAMVSEGQRSLNRSIRLANRKAHQQLVSMCLDNTARLMSQLNGNRLILLDACNATRAAREHWTSLFPRAATRICVVHVSTSNDVAMQRVFQRGSHPVLCGDSMSLSQSVYNVARIFESPHADEGHAILTISPSCIREGSDAILQFLNFMDTCVVHPPEAGSVNIEDSDLAYFKKTLLNGILRSGASLVECVCVARPVSHKWNDLVSESLRLLQEEASAAARDGSSNRWLSRGLFSQGLAGPELHHKFQLQSMSSLHCTLAFARGMGDSSIVNSFFLFTKEQYSDSTQVELLVDGVVADRSCVAATVASVAIAGHVVATTESEFILEKGLQDIPLHITLALRDGVSPAHAGDLCSQMKLIEDRNRNEEEIRSGKRPRDSESEKRHKIANVAALKFMKPFSVIGFINTSISAI